MRPLATLMLGLIHGAGAAFAAEPAQPSLAAFVGDVHRAFDGGLEADRGKMAEKAGRLRIKALADRGNYVLRSSAQVVEQRPWEVDEETTREQTQLALNNQLTYSNIDSVELTVSANGNWRDVENQRSLFGGKPRDFFNRSYNVTARAAYDVMHGGASGVASTRRRIERLQVLRQQVNADGELAAARVRIGAIAIDFYANECRARLFKVASETAAAASAAAAVQLRSGIATERDVLGIFNLEGGMRRRLAAAESQRIVLLGQLQAVSGDSARRASEAMPERFPCPSIGGLGVDVEKVLADKRRLSEGQAKARELAHADDIAKQSMHASRVATAPSVKPFVLGRYTPPLKPAIDNGSVTLGVSVEWTIPTARVDLTAAGGEIAAKIAGARYADAVADGEARIVALTEQLAAYARMRKIIEESLDNALRGAELAAKQLEARLIDAVVYANAVSGKLDAEQALLDAWTQIAKIELELASFLSST